MKHSMIALAILAVCGFANAQTQETSTTTTTTEPVAEKTVVVEKEREEKTDGNSVDKGGFYWEPMITYQKGEGTLELPAVLGGDADGDFDGFGAGLRLGMHASEVIFVAADFRHSWLEFDGTDAKAWNLGPSVGLQMPNYGLRLWGTYVLTGEADLDENDDFDVTFKKATGWRLGAGLRVLSFSVNAEYQDLKYSEANGNAGALATEFETDARDESWIASISFPMEL